MKQHERLVRELKQFSVASVIIWDRNMARPMTTQDAARQALLDAAAELKLEVRIRKVEYKTCVALMAQVKQPDPVQFERKV